MQVDSWASLYAQYDMTRIVRSYGSRRLYCEDDMGVCVTQLGPSRECFFFFFPLKVDAGPDTGDRCEVGEGSKRNLGLMVVTPGSGDAGSGRSTGLSLRFRFFTLDCPASSAPWAGGGRIASLPRSSLRFFFFSASGEDLRGGLDSIRVSSSSYTSSSGSAGAEVGMAAEAFDVLPLLLARPLPISISISASISSAGLGEGRLSRLRLRRVVRSGAGRGIGAAETERWMVVGRKTKGKRDAGAEARAGRSPVFVDDLGPDALLRRLGGTGALDGSSWARCERCKRWNACTAASVMAILLDQRRHLAGRRQ